MKKTTKGILGVASGLLLAGLGIAGLIKKDSDLIQEFDDQHDEDNDEVVDLDELEDENEE